MGVIDSWLKEHIVLHTPTGAYDPNAKSLVQGSVGSRKRGTRCVLHQADAPVRCGHTQQNTQMKYTTTANGRAQNNATSWNQSFWRNVLFVAGTGKCCLAFAIMLEKPMVARDSRDPLAIQDIFFGWNRSVPRGINIATSSDDGEIEEVFTSTTVGSRDTVFSFVPRRWREVSNRGKTPGVRRHDEDGARRARQAKACLLAPSCRVRSQA